MRVSPTDWMASFFFKLPFYIPLFVSHFSFFVSFHSLSRWCRLNFALRSALMSESECVCVWFRTPTPTHQMPFIQRIVEPVFLSRPTPPSPPPLEAAAAAAAPSTASSSASGQATQSKRNDLSTGDEFTTIANCTLSNILRQLASVILCADEILGGLGDELLAIRARTENIKRRINGVERILDEEIDETVICKLLFIRSPRYLLVAAVCSCCLCDDRWTR